MKEAPRSPRASSKVIPNEHNKESKERKGKEKGKKERKKKRTVTHSLCVTPHGVSSQAVTRFINVE